VAQIKRLLVVSFTVGGKNWPCIAWRINTIHNTDIDNLNCWYRQWSRRLLS